MGNEAATISTSVEFTGIAESGLNSRTLGAFPESLQMHIATLGILWHYVLLGSNAKFLKLGQAQYEKELSWNLLSDIQDLDQDTTTQILTHLGMDSSCKGVLSIILLLCPPVLSKIKKDQSIKSVHEEGNVNAESLTSLVDKLHRALPSCPTPLGFFATGVHFYQVSQALGFLLQHAFKLAGIEGKDKVQRVKAESIKVASCIYGKIASGSIGLNNMQLVWIRALLLSGIVSLSDLDIDAGKQSMCTIKDAVPWIAAGLLGTLDDDEAQQAVEQMQRLDPESSAENSFKLRIALVGTGLHVIQEMQAAQVSGASIDEMLELLLCFVAF